MRIKKVIVLTLASLILTGCSSPQRITLKDSTIIETRDRLKYNEKTGFYRYEDLSGKNKNINRDSILKIEEI